LDLRFLSDQPSALTAQFHYLRDEEGPAPVDDATSASIKSQELRPTGKGNTQRRRFSRDGELVLVAPAETSRQHD
jgi:hypothetical protein